ncbi:MAG: hypothetical protein RXQ94_07755 [Caldivirga sp.]
MGAERVVGRCRLNVNVYPAVSCVASLYTGVRLPISTSTNVEDITDNARVGEPVPVNFKAIQGCMGAYFHRGSPELVRRGLNPAVDCLGYVEAVEGPSRVKYIPTLMGVIDSAIYLALFNTLLDKLGKSGAELTPETVHALVRFMRLMVFWESLRKYDDVPWLIDGKLYYKLLNCDECLSQGSCLNNSSYAALFCKIDEKSIKRWREEFLYSAIIAKAIAGVEVRGIEPRQLGIVFKKAYTIASDYAKKFITPSDSAEIYSTFRTTYSEIKDNPLFKTMEYIHRVLDTMVGEATIYLISKLVGNLMSSLSKPLTNATVNSEGKQHRLER